MDAQRRLYGLLAQLMRDYEMTPAEAMDWVAIHELGYTQTEWARSRGAMPQSVHNNLRRAESKAESADASPE